MGVWGELLLQAISVERWAGVDASTGKQSSSNSMSESKLILFSGDGGAGWKDGWKG